MPKARSQSNGKLVDTWWYEYTGVPVKQDGEPEAKPIKVAVKLYIVKKFKGDTPPLATKEVWFELVCENPEFNLKGPDVEALRAVMWGELDKTNAAKASSSSFCRDGAAPPPPPLPPTAVLPFPIKRRVQRRIINS